MCAGGEFADRARRSALNTMMTLSNEDEGAQNEVSLVVCLDGVLVCGGCVCGGGDSGHMYALNTMITLANEDEGAQNEVGQQSAGACVTHTTVCQPSQPVVVCNVRQHSCCAALSCGWRQRGVGPRGVFLPDSNAATDSLGA